MRKYNSLTRLAEKLVEEDLVHGNVQSGRTWIHRMIKKGKLTLPKFAFSGRYALTKEVIDEAIDSLKSKGEYHYEE